MGHSFDAVCIRTVNPATHLDEKDLDLICPALKLAQALEDDAAENRVIALVISIVTRRGYSQHHSAKFQGCISS